MPSPRALALVCVFALTGCGTGSFNLPHDSKGPTVSSIVRRIQCELLTLITDDSSETAIRLINGNYNALFTLYLSVSDSGELAPSLTVPLTPTLGIGAGARFSRLRERMTTQNLFFALPELRKQWDLAQTLPPGASGVPFGSCPERDTNLAGELGIVETVRQAMTAPNPHVGAALQSSASGEFGGSITFVVTSNVNSLGPTWTIAPLKASGLGGFTHVNTDRISYAFAVGKPGADATQADKERLESLMSHWERGAPRGF
jgi:hypothetical protein